ncbi:hypothetical protein ES703_18944 [subsurface metagenome]
MTKLTKKQKVGTGLGIFGLITVVVAAIRAKAAPPEVCIPGETKCVGFDLYECSPECKWTLVEANSPACGWVPGEAEFQVTDLLISPSEVYIGEPVTISVLVTNVGGERGTKTVTLEVS